MTKKPTQSIFGSWSIIFLILFFAHAHAEDTPFQRETFVRQWGGSGTQPGQFDIASGLAVFNNEVFVVDSGNSRIQVFTTSGSFLREWGEKGGNAGQFEEPGGLAISSTGDIYVTDTYNNRIQVFKTDGTFVRQWGTNGNDNGQFDMPIGIAVSSTNDVFVTDRDNFRVQVFDALGNYKNKWGSQGEGNSEFEAPVGLAVSANNEVFVTDEYLNRVQVFTTTGSFKRKWSGADIEDGQFESPTHIALYNSEVFVSDQYNNRIQVFAENGQFKRQWGGIGTAVGQFNLPAGLAIANTGEIFVSNLDLGSQRIQVFRTATVFPQGMNLAPTTLSGDTSTAQFKIALRDADNILINQDAIAPGESAQLTASITIMPAHVGQSGGLLVVAIYEGAIFMKTANSWIPWDLNPETLVAFTEKTAYADEESFTIQDDINNLGLSGIFNVFTGYRTATGDVHFNAEPFIFAVTP